MPCSAEGKRVKLTPLEGVMVAPDLLFNCLPTRKRLVLSSCAKCLPRWLAWHPCQSCVASISGTCFT